MKRPVIVWVDDPEVDRIDVVGWAPPPMPSGLEDSPPEHTAAFVREQVPVPPDDQLTHAIRLLMEMTTSAAVRMEYGSFRDRLHDAVATVRAAFDLDG